MFKEQLRHLYGMSEVSKGDSSSKSCGQRYNGTKAYIHLVKVS